MHPTAGRYVMNARVEDMHREAADDRLARAARRARTRTTARCGYPAVWSPLWLACVHGPALTGSGQHPHNRSRRPARRASRTRLVRAGHDPQPDTGTLRARESTACGGHGRDLDRHSRGRSGPRGRPAYSPATARRRGDAASYLAHTGDRGEAIVDHLATLIRNRLHGPAPSQQPAQVLHAARAGGRADADLDLSQDGVLPRGEPHVARQRQFAARPAGPAAAGPGTRSTGASSTGSSGGSLRRSGPSTTPRSRAARPPSTTPITSRS